MQHKLQKPNWKVTKEQITATRAAAERDAQNLFAGKMTGEGGKNALPCDQGIETQLSILQGPEDVGLVAHVLSLLALT